MPKNKDSIKLKEPKSHSLTCLQKRKANSTKKALSKIMTQMMMNKQSMTGN